MQTTPPSDASQDVSTQTSDQPVSSLSFDVAVQTSFHSVQSSSLDAAVQTLPHSTVSQDVSTQMGARPDSSFSLDAAVQSRHRYKAILVVSHCLHFLTSPDSDDHVRSLAPRVLLQRPLGLEQYAPPPGLDIDADLCASHGIPVKAARLRPRLRSAISVTPPQPLVCTIHVGAHPVRSATTGKRSASTALSGTHNPVDTDPPAGTGPFP